MKSRVAIVQPEPEVVSSRLMTRTFIGLAVLASLSVGLSVAGKWFGGSIALAGYSEDVSPREIVIGNNVIVAPANMIRFESARHDGVASQIDLYMRWPQMDGYSREAKDDFNNVGSRNDIVFIRFEPQMMSRDMSDRYDPIYRSLIEPASVAGPAGLSLHAFTAKSGYVNEVLAVAERPGATPYVARCLADAAGADVLTPCERDVLVGEGLSLSYRFPKRLLAEWRTLDAAVLKAGRSMLQTGH
jgi:hypothetical protein